MSELQQDIDLRVLEYICDNDQGLNGPAELSGLWELVGQETTRTTGISLRQRGLIRDGNRYSGGYHITADGRAMIEAMKQRRSDRGYRRIECREQLLRWIDDKDATDAGSRVAREDFDGSADLLPFTQEDSQAAATYLKQHDLIQSISTAEAEHILLWITEQGRECIDHGRGIAAYLNRMDATGNQIWNIFGSGHNIAAALGDNNEVTASLNQFDHEAALKFAAAVREGRPTLALPDNVEDLLADIEQGEDPQRSHKATAFLTNFLLGTTTGTLGQVLGMLGAAALGIGA